MRSSKLIKDLILAFLSQGLGTLLSVLMTLILPKFLGVAEYGYWQLFIFYLSYIGFFHFGINDGVYLIYGGEERSSLDKKSINSQFVVSVIYQTIISIALIGIALLGPFEPEREFVIVWLGIILLANNCSFYLGYVFQAINETSLFSYSAALDSAVFLGALLVLALFGTSSFEPYVVCYTLAKLVRLLYCIWHARDILSSGYLTPRRAIADSLSSIRVGIKLMFANIVGSLILGVVRFFVDANWGIEVFSVVSFSLSIASFFLTFLTQVSMVLFPNLKQSGEALQKSVFRVMRDALDLILPAFYCFYGPISIILNWWLPQYAQSIQLFSMLFPIVVFEGKMDIVGTTFFKVLRFEKQLLNINVLSLALSFVVVLIGSLLFQSIELTLTGVVVILGLRSALSEAIISRTLGLPQSKLSFEAIGISVLFVLVSQFVSAMASSGVFCVVYAVYVAVNRSLATGLIEDVRTLSGAK